MKVRLHDKKYVIRFTYDRYRTECVFRVEGHTTTAALHKIQPNGEVCKEIICTTKAVCSANDNFCKATGRKIAFARMVKWLSYEPFFLSKEERKSLWEDYFREHSPYIFLNMKEVKDGEKVS